MPRIRSRSDGNCDKSVATGVDSCDPLATERTSVLVRLHHRSVVSVHKLGLARPLRACCQAPRIFARRVCNTLVVTVPSCACEKCWRTMLPCTVEMSAPVSTMNSTVADAAPCCTNGLIRSCVVVVDVASCPRRRYCTLRSPLWCRCEQTFAKWFAFLHTLQVLPFAGHSGDRGLWPILPQPLHGVTLLSHVLMPLWDSLLLLSTWVCRFDHCHNCAAMRRASECLGRVRRCLVRLH